jgi:RND family efflux transporter MFP subunit
MKSVKGTSVLQGVLWVLLIACGGTARAEPGSPYEGLIEPSEVVQVSSHVRGTLEAVMVERGDRVEKGQAVARITSEVEEAAVELARSRVEFALRKVERNEDLYRQELISIHEKDEMETELRIARLELQEAEARLSMRTIRSPVHGVVAERMLSPGEYVGEDPILEIARIHPLYVEVVVPVERFGSIQKGMEAEVRPELPGSEPRTARVIIVDRVMDAASGTFGVRLRMPNPGHRLPAGLKCRVSFR